MKPFLAAIENFVGYVLWTTPTLGK